MLVAAYTVVPTAGQIALYLLIVFGAPAVLLVGSSRHARSARRPWQLIAAGLTALGGAGIAFDFQHVSPFDEGSAARLFYAIGYPLLIAGLVLLLAAAHGGWNRAALVEAGILAVALMLIQLAILTTFSDAFVPAPTVGFATTLVYALAGGLLLACAGHVVVATIRRAPATLAILLAAVALLVADEGDAIAPHSHALGSWPNTSWLLAYVLFATAAVAPSTRNLSRQGTRASGLPIARLTSLGIALLALPALIVFSTVTSLSQTMDVVIAAGAVLLVALVLMHIVGLVGSAVRAHADELAERRRAEAARNQFAVLIGSLQGGVLLLDANRRVVLANEAFCSIFGLAETPGQLAGAFSPHTGDTIAKLVAEPHVFRERLEALIGRRELASGEEIDFVDGRSFLRDHIPVFRDGAYEGSLWHYLDITDLKRSELELEKARDQALEATRLKSEFLATMSHEIRTPMYGVIGAIDLLRTTPLDTMQRELTTVLHDSANALLSLLNDILDFSKIEAHKLTLAVNEIDVRALVEGVLDAVAVDARNHDLWLSSYVSPAIPTHIRGDATRLRQILLNLVGNAIKFTPAGEIAVRAEIQSSDETHVELRLTVRDTGIGIAPDAQTGLFEPFTQIDSSTSRLHAGSGLGLAICARLADLMGGSISCESALGKGTVMTVTVSLERAEDPVRDAVAPPLEGLRATLVSSRPLALAALAATLEEAGAETRCVASVADTDALLGSADVVLCDAEQAHLLPSAPPAIALAGRQVTGAARAATAILPVSRNQLLRLVGRAVAAGPGGTGETDADEPRRGREAAQTKGGTILVVEDDEINRQLAVRQLARLGYAARSVGSGIDAITALEHGVYAAVLMDCRMPGMDGIATTKAIRKAEAGVDRHIPIIAITADAQPKDRIRCLAAGMDDYLVKPLTIDTLGTCVDRWLAPDDAAADAVVDETLARLVDEIGDTTVLELIRLWADALPARVESLLRAIEEDDSELAFSTAHVVKSTTGALGGTRAAQLAAQLEEAAQTGSVTAATTLVSDLTAELRRVKRELKAFDACAAATRR